MLQLGGSCLGCEATSDNHVKQDPNAGRLKTYPLRLEEPVGLQKRTESLTS